jgi:hypothetical protein
MSFCWLYPSLYVLVGSGAPDELTIVFCVVGFQWALHFAKPQEYTLVFVCESFQILHDVRGAHLLQVSFIAIIPLAKVRIHPAPPVSARDP